jgi:beta-glucosidase-like glycosyl hydrolase
MTHPQPSYRNPNLPIDQRVADLLGRMTLAEKLAQMSIFPGNIAEDVDSLLDEAGQLDVPRALAAWPHGVGAIGRLGLHRSPGDTARLYNEIQQTLLEQTRLGIPALFVDEALHGLMAQGSASFPQAIALASTWDPDLVQEVFAAAAAEMRARGGNYALTPVLDLARDPRWGRTEETYGEDPHLAATIGVAAVRGLQGDGLPIAPDRVLATAKHFAVHGQPEAGCNGGPTNFAQRDIREVFLHPFQAAVVEAGVQSVMASYNEIDGVPVHANRWLLHDVLRGEWSFQGLVTSDGNGISQLVSEHHVAADTAEAARLALLAGVDFELDEAFPTLLGQVQAGLVPEAAIDQAVGRVLRAKFLLGLFEQPYADPDHAERITNCAAHQAGPAGGAAGAGAAQERRPAAAGRVKPAHPGRDRPQRGRPAPGRLQRGPRPRPQRAGRPARPAGRRSAGALRRGLPHHRGRAGLAGLVERRRHPGRPGRGRRAHRRGRGDRPPGRRGRCWCWARTRPPAARAGRPNTWATATRWTCPAGRTTWRGLCWPRERRW